MTTAQLYDDDIERKLHSTAMEGLTRELGRPLPDVSVIYEHALRELKAEAKVKEYLSIFACRQVREVSRQL